MLLRRAGRVMQPVITGLGLVTPLGGTARSTWDALLAGRFISDHVPMGQEAGRIGALAEAAAQQAIDEAGWTAEILQSPGTALVVGTSKGRIIENVKWKMENGEGAPLSPFSIFHFPFSIQTGGPRWTLSAACASGLHALIQGTMLLQGGQARRVLVVAAEASVHPLFLGSFRRLGVLASPEVGCRPFDREREGFLMSEAAAAVCLELPEDAGGRECAVVEGMALGADAHHLTGVDPQGRVLQRCLERAAAGRPVDLVQAHGTGTASNDAVELAVIEGTLGNDAPVLYSHKGALGHSLGASGLVSIVLNCLSHRHGLAPPNVRTLNPMPTRLMLERQPVRRAISRSVALAAGFGGAVAAVGLRSAE